MGDLIFENSRRTLISKSQLYDAGIGGLRNVSFTPAAFPAFALAEGCMALCRPEQAISEINNASPIGNALSGLQDIVDQSSDLLKAVTGTGGSG